MSERSEPIAVVGMACRFPGGEDLDGYWDLIRTGRVATAPVSPDRWRHGWLHDADDLRAADFAYTDVVAHLADVDSFAAQRYALAPRRIEVTDPQHRLLVTLTDDALRDAGLGAIPRDRTGVYVGASVSEYKDLLTSRIRARQMAAGEFGAPLDADAARAAVDGVAPPRAYTIPGTLLNMAAATVSAVFDFSGPSFVVDAACASALVALHEAVVHLRAGECDLAVAGGVYLNLVPDNLIGFSRIGAVSRAGVCRPFDRRADGFVLGEGAGVVVLKRLADALRDGDRPYAVIRGTGCANDGRAEGPMTPRLEGQVTCLRRAYRDAAVDPAAVGFVECHGTATPAGDAVELAALREVFGAGGATEVSSVKANIGHTMSAAGIAGLIKAVLVLRHATVPPQVGCDEPDPMLGSLRVSDTARPWARNPGAPRRAGVSSFGFGGTNVHVVLEEAPGAPHPVTSSPRDGQATRYWAVRRGSAPASPDVRGEPAGSSVPAPTADALMAAIASAGAYPEDSLRPDQALVDDLGFDSLMLLELEEHLAKAYPGLDRLPDELLQRTTTIAEVAAWLDRHAGPPVAHTEPLVDDRLPELAALGDRLSLAERLGVPNPYFVAHDGALGATTVVDGAELIDFSGYDYLGLATDPAVVAAAAEAVARYGTSVSASRVASGERPLHRDLEAEIADLLGAEAALTMVSGHATNVGVLGHLLRPGDLALHDALAHDSILQGIRLSGASRRPFPHNDLAALDRLLTDLAPRHRRVVVAVEGVYSMDGDLADLPALVELRRRHGFLLYVDEAHSVGVLGATGRGAGEHWDVAASDVDIWMGTLSKALASCGGYVAGEARLIEYLRYTTPGFVYSVGLPPAAGAAALAALRRLRAEPGRVARLTANTALFRRLAAEAGLAVGSGTAPVVPVLTGGSSGALLLADRMRRRGVNVQPILYPAVEDSAARLRFFINASHTPQQLEDTVAALAAEVASL
ncbi:aminotransferase class I/II-fold pyridoxal phosphate-dependent enzyme [Planosporangium thailandense]|uniref:Aminotransferase class I/II-fold pyridoxal phosphate-dependent enzyme n=1 Tax=Planosporangium thailandense TaxID=765197 RepID=A0ABX0Y787_9ACTN|nr:aminotransferase class I/II-fold pyridoxal phosphate-dependent enzyme [Planosporangium thailandense]NJC73164.1 aminotransferase class I/II-fold pyridoxal phosphate-dependent enzyme [Planosporangium thailandense]